METNFEHFKDEIIKKMFIAGNRCSFIQKYILGYKCTDNIITCSKCNEIVEEWLNAPYIEKSESEIKIDWTKVPVDTPVYVWKGEKDAFKVKAHFSHYANGEYFCFINGTTSWTTKATYSQPYCELANPKDIEKYRKN